MTAIEHDIEKIRHDIFYMKIALRAGFETFDYERIERREKDLEQYKELYPEYFI